MSIEKAQLDYCAGIFDRQTAHKERLEKKAHFHLSLVTLFLGAVFLKPDFLAKTAGMVEQPTTPELFKFVIPLAAVAVCAGLAWALIGVLASMRLQSYKNEYPADLVTALFEPESRFYVGAGEDGLHRAAAEGFALAVEANRRVNERKAAHVKQASVGVFCATSSLIVLIGSVAVINVYAAHGG